MFSMPDKIVQRKIVEVEKFSFYTIHSCRDCED